MRAVAYALNLNVKSPLLEETKPVAGGSLSSRRRKFASDEDLKNVKELPALEAGGLKALVRELVSTGPDSPAADPATTKRARDHQRVFVSHAGADREFANTFVTQILRLGLGLTPDQIFYSSDPSTGVKAGNEWFGGILDELRSRPLTIVLLTDGFWESTMCLLEAGAAVLNDGALIVRQSKAVDRSVLGAIQGFDADNTKHLVKLMEDVASSMGIDLSASRANAAAQEVVSFVESATKLN